MNTKAQLGLFLVIGAILLMAVSFYIFTKATTTDPLAENSYSQEAAPVREFVEFCMEQTAENGLEHIALQGGHYTPPTHAKQFHDAVIPYYWRESSSFLPSLSHIKQEYEEYVEDIIHACLDEFDSLEALGYDISTSETPEVDVSFNQEDTSITMNYKIEATLAGGTKTSLTSFTTRLPIPFSQFYTHVNDFITAQEQTPKGVPLSYLTRQGAEHDFQFQYHIVDQDALIVFLFDQPSKEQPLLYAFFNNYGWTPTTSTEVDVQPITPVTLTESNPISIQVQATGTDLTFSDNSPHYDINPATGRIEFDPYLLENGEYLSVVTARSEQGAEDSEFFYLTVDFGGGELTVQDIGTLTATVGEGFSFNVQASASEDIIFLDDSDLFNIHPVSGEIRFTPQSAGTFTFVITATTINDSKTVSGTLIVE